MTHIEPPSSSEPRRKGARRISEIPPEVLSALNAGEEETITLVEWLAIDMAKLMRAIAPQVGLSRQQDELESLVLALSGLGITTRMKGTGAALRQVLSRLKSGTACLEQLASHRSDMVRGWAAYVLMADDSLTLTERLNRSQRFAADRSMAVRECAWDSLRPWLALELETAFRLLKAWVRHPEATVRRCAVEATRPCGVWCVHLPDLKRDPSPGLTLLEHCRADDSRYVQTSVGNWLNDASKSCPDWVRDVCRRWELESACPQTQWIVKHALRTLRRKQA